MVCALGREDGTIIEQVSIPTTTPEETIPKITAYFKDKGIEALGIGAFGPVVVDPKAIITVISLKHQSWHGEIRISLAV